MHSLVLLKFPVMVDTVVQVSILTDFLSSYPITYRERGVEINCNYTSVCFFLAFCQCLPHVLCSSLIRGLNVMYSLLISQLSS